METNESELHEIIGALLVFKVKATQTIVQLKAEIERLKKRPPVPVVPIEDVEFATN